MTYFRRSQLPAMIAAGQLRCEITYQSTTFDGHIKEVLTYSTTKGKWLLDLSRVRSKASGVILLDPEPKRLLWNDDIIVSDPMA